MKLIHLILIIVFFFWCCWGCLQSSPPRFRRGRDQSFSKLTGHLCPETHQRKCCRKKRGTNSLFFVLGFWLSTLRNTACLRFTPGELLSSAICVQRFSNWEVLQLIPLIAVCCVLQRIGKPSHPSWHVVGAMPQRTETAKREFVFFCFDKSFRKNDPAAGSPTATLLRLLLPLLKKCRWTFKQRETLRLSDHLHCTIIGNNDGRCVQRAGT